MRVVIVALFLVLALPEGVMAARWQKAEVPVWDFTPDEWRPIVQASVDDFNANMPAGVPRLVYTPMGELSCDSLPEYGKRGGISVCVGAVDPSMPWGYTARDTVGSRMFSVGVQLGRDFSPAYRDRLVCHEFMHAVTSVPDDVTNPHEHESCVQGGLGHLGPWDIAYAQQVYQEMSHRSGGHHRRRHR